MKSSVWERAQKIRKSLEEKRNAKKKSEILKKLSSINPSEDWEEAISLLSELSLFSNEEDLSENERQIVEKCLSESEKKHSEKLAAEKAARAPQPDID